jgi:hypothetical protein
MRRALKQQCHAGYEACLSAPFPLTGTTAAAPVVGMHSPDMNQATQASME